MIMLVASPIAYTPDMVPAALKPLLALNPFAYFVVAYQQVDHARDLAERRPHLILLVVMSLGDFLRSAAGSSDRAKRVIVDYV